MLTMPERCALGGHETRTTSLAIAVRLPAGAPPVLVDCGSEPGLYKQRRVRGITLRGFCSGGVWIINLGMHVGMYTHMTATVARSLRDKRTEQKWHRPIIGHWCCARGEAQIADTLHTPCGLAKAAAAWESAERQTL